MYATYIVNISKVKTKRYNADSVPQACPARARRVDRVEDADEVPALAVDDLEELDVTVHVLRLIAEFVPYRE